MSPPHTHYAKSNGVNIAYQAVGDGPVDLVYVPGWVSHVELAWELPSSYSVSSDSRRSRG